MCVMPASQVEFLGNWDVIGLVGTGSVDYRIDNVFVGEDYTFRRLALGARRGQASLHLGLLPNGIAGHMGVAFGTARRALEELGLYRSSRAYGMEALHQALDGVESGNPVTDLQLQRIRHATSLAVAAALSVVTFAYTWSGSAGLRSPHPLGRLMRDMHGQTQHVLIDENARIGAAPAIMDSYR